MRALVALRVAFLLTLFACEQPAPKCTVARGTFSARYTLIPGSKVGSGDCDTLRGDELSVQAYSQSRKDSVYPDSSNIQVGIQAATLSHAISRAQACGLDNLSGLPPYSLGSFARAKPDQDDFCEVPALTVGRVVLPTQDACQPHACSPPLPPEPAVAYTYEWSHVRVYVTAGAYGTQFAADLTYTKDDCSAVYRVVAVYPSVSCAQEIAPAQNLDASVTADAGAQLNEPDGCRPEPPPAEYVASEALCSEDAPLVDGVATGANINPEFMVQCDPQQLRCVLRGDPPSLR